MESQLLDSFSRGTIQLFVGAGLSSDRYLGAADLRRRFLDERIYVGGKETSVRTEMGNIPDDRISLEDAAEFYELYRDPSDVVSMIQKIYGEKKRPAAIHEKLWRLPHVRWIYTTNFDTLIEDALARPKSPPEIVTGGTALRTALLNRRVVFKPHGCARTSSARTDFVITRTDYLNYASRRTLETLKTLYDLSTKVFLFLGYGLSDLNMRYMITEANRAARIRSYAVLAKASGPEAKYWHKLGVTIIEQTAEKFVAEILRFFPAEESEWEEKVDARVVEKEEIARKALGCLREAIQRSAQGTDTLNVILDAGSTTWQMATLIASEVNQGTISLDNVRMITNSPIAMRELEQAIVVSRNMPAPVLVGGPFRHETRAYTPDEGNAKQQLHALRMKRSRTIAFIGATAIHESGLMTKTEAEIPIKAQFIANSGSVFVLVDHSKRRGPTQEYHIFAPLERDRMSIITDRPNEMADFGEYVKQVI